ncbi:ATP-dependent Clp protease proteolytic subunit [uncultured Campylobacter sp.]|uniref:ATP-dependent Clp protease proteolytic subunit n=1 Tax=uncultured Campylobacter sp. TaxID=218934 RepID=UPI0026094148|nr:ATP-dependent Clp protease proteolytic subunit [uncultured Campylobacter sp.]
MATKDLEQTMVDIRASLLTDRNLFLYGEINSNTCLHMQEQLLFLNGEDESKEITMYINGPGGVISDGLGLIDIIKSIKAPVNTVCVGLAASMSALIFINGDRRYMLPNSQLMLHQPLGGAFGQASDIELLSAQILKTKANIHQMIANSSALDVKKIEKLTDRDCYVDANTALKYKLADEILISNKIKNVKAKG